ncbi:MAG TPA: dTDP-4-dehydrorhamnose reductase [Bacteroidota bacterium]|jgi:dTDP-4-dehydrorhamnose reductase|nr:dTDP-4-dehydrorhamnose reductase [Bacteroidota bacterium]
MKRVLITGSNGLLGQKLVELLSNSPNYMMLLTSKQEASVFQDERLQYRQLDISHKQQLSDVVEEFEPEIIVNTAAMTNVDQCETEREAAWRANVTGVENLVRSAKLVGARIIQLSTDYVFDGKSGPYNEVDRPNPLSYYGRTKLASENVLQTSGIPAAILRTMVLYGIGFGIKLNFALWLLKNLSEDKPVRVVDDQVGNPTLADDLAYAILKIIELERTGVYNVAGPDLVSRHDFALALARVFNYNKKRITAVKTSSMKQQAARPLRSGFITLKAQTDLGVRLSGVEQGLHILKNQLNTNLKQYLKTL